MLCFSCNTLFSPLVRAAARFGGRKEEARNEKNLSIGKQRKTSTNARRARIIWKTFYFHASWVFAVCAVCTTRARHWSVWGQFMLIKIDVLFLFSALFSQSLHFVLLWTVGRDVDFAIGENLTSSTPSAMQANSISGRGLCVICDQ